MNNKKIDEKYASILKIDEKYIKRNAEKIIRESMKQAPNFIKGLAEL